MKCIVPALLIVCAVAAAAPIMLQVVPVSLSPGCAFVLTPGLHSDGVGLKGSFDLDVIETAIGVKVADKMGIAIGSDIWEYHTPLNDYTALDLIWGSVLPLYAYATWSLNDDERDQTLVFGRIGGNVWLARAHYLWVGAGLSKTFEFWSGKLELGWRRQFTGGPTDAVSLYGSLALGGWYQFGGNRGRGP